MKYSVVMPVYLRRESHKEVVEHTIASIKSHSDDYELIIIDDASPLDTTFLKEAADIYIRHEVNGGISKAWNTGKNASSNEYVAIVNDDIKVPRLWLEALEGGFENDKTGTTAPMKGGPNTRPSMPCISEYADKKFYPGYCFMLKKDRFFEDFDEQFTTNCGDTDYWHRVYKANLECMRVGLCVWHREGGVLHGMDYLAISEESINKFINKWGFNPQKEYYA